MEKDLLKAHQEHDIFLYQSDYDGSPRSVIEALSSGIPAIIAHHPGTDVLDPEGKYIAFTDYSDVDTILKNIEDYIANPAKWIKRAETGRNIIIENFSTKVVAKKYFEFYQSHLKTQSTNY